MHLFTFTANFDIEQACGIHFKEQRNEVDVVCNCGSEEHFWVKSTWRVMSAKNVGVRSPFEVERLCTVQNFLF